MFCCGWTAQYSLERSCAGYVSSRVHSCRVFRCRGLDHARRRYYAYKPMIELMHLRKEYDALLAVDDVCLTVPQGEIFGLIGPNGAGKTTTIRMAAGLLAPTMGRALVAGVDVAQEPERAQQYIGYLADFFALYEDLKVWEYLDYFAHAYKLPESEIPSGSTKSLLRSIWKSNETR